MDKNNHNNQWLIDLLGMLKLCIDEMIAELSADKFAAPGDVIAGVFGKLKIDSEGQLAGIMREIVVKLSILHAMMTLPKKK